MKKTIIATALLLATNIAFATCNTKTETWDQGNRAGTWDTVESYHVYNIVNNTNIDQTYQVCYELVTQFFDHSHVYRTNQCDSVTLKPGQATGDVGKHVNVKVNYPQVSNYYYTAIDADTSIKGECQSHMHVIKRLKVWW